MDRQTEEVIEKLETRIKAARKAAEKAIEEGADPAAHLAEIRALQDEISMRASVERYQVKAAAQEFRITQIAALRGKAETVRLEPLEERADRAISLAAESVKLFDQLSRELRAEGNFAALATAAGQFGATAERIRNLVINVRHVRTRLGNARADLLAEAAAIEKILRAAGVEV